ncbi:MAG: hypothetical protein ACM30G_23325 [Micromonosporaceae bacterium]
MSYEQVRDWALALPGSAEVMVPEWDHPTLRVNNKMFASGAPDATPSPDDRGRDSAPAR